MAAVVFTSHLQRHLACPPQTVVGGTVREALEQVFAGHDKVRGYLLDDQGALRKHVAIFVDGEHIRDRTGLTDAIRPDAEIFVMQALSGG